MQSWIDHHPQALFMILPLWFLMIWLVLGVVVSHTGGWSELAKRFRFETEYSGRRWNWQSGKMRWGTNYNGCLTVGSGPEGLYLATAWMFRVRHAPLLVPWPEIEVSRGQVLWWKYVRFRMGREERISLRISAKLGEQVKQAAGANWPVESVG